MSEHPLTEEEEQKALERYKKRRPLTPEDYKAQIGTAKTVKVAIDRNERFVQLVIALLQEEQGQTEENAHRLVRENTGIMLNGILAGYDYRATALALLKAKQANVD